MFEILNKLTGNQLFILSIIAMFMILGIVIFILATFHTVNVLNFIQLKKDKEADV